MKFGICNELVHDRDFQKTCDLIAGNGFTGLEIAPFTLFNDPLEVSPVLIRSAGKTMQKSGLECIGFHWILKSPKGMRLLEGDIVTLNSTWKRIAALSSICADLGGSILVLGSGKERSYGNLLPEQAKENFIDKMSELAPILEKDGVELLIEALPGKNTNFINTIQEAAEIIKAIQSPAIASMFDFHNCDDEVLSMPDLIKEYKDIIRHVHLNTLDGKHAKAPAAKLFSDVFLQLSAIDYRGWVSLEIFDFNESPETVLKETYGFLSSLELSV